MTTTILMTGTREFPMGGYTKIIMSRCWKALDVQLDTDYYRLYKRKSGCW